MPQILTICIGGASKTRVVYEANLNFRTARPYIDLLSERGLIAVLEGNRLVYETTLRGMELLRSLEKIQGSITQQTQP